MKVTIELPETLSFTFGETVRTVKTADVPPASIAALAMYGRRKGNDSVNGSVHAEKDKPQSERKGRAHYADEWIGALMAGTLGESRGGFARLSDLEKELRERVKTFLIESCGYKAGEAGKLISAEGSEGAFFGTIAKELGATDAQASAAWDTLRDHARKTVEARKAGPSLDDLLS